jgi:PAT family beta-lactamase induction signal transducer AmpG
MAVPRVIISAPTGWMVERMGWTAFFLACTVLAVPGLLLVSAVSDDEGPLQPEPPPADGAA